MAKIPEALRKKLLDQKKEMASGGLLISNKEWTKGRVRLLPCTDELPGHRVVSYYCKSLSGDKKGSTSPETFGLPCPIAEAFSKLKKEDKEVRDRAYEMVNKQVEYWVPVVVRGQEGTPDAPNIRIFPLKKTVYSKVNDFLTDEDVGEDITHAIEGRDLLVKKTGSGLDTEWSVDKLDPSPLHKDKAMRAALIAAGKDMDVRQHFFGIDYDVLAAIYEALTGDPMPEKFRKAAKGAASAKPKSRVAEAEEEVEETEETGETEEVEIEVGARVSFTDADDNTIEGEVKSIEDGTASVEDDDGGEWDVEVGSLTLVEAEGSDDGEGESEGDEDGDGEDGEADADEDGEDGEDEADAPEIVKGSRVTFEGEDDATVTGKVVSIKGDTAKVKDDEGGDWNVDVSALTLADEDAAEDAEEDEPEEAAPKVTRKGPPKAAAKPSAKKPAKGEDAEDDAEEEQPNRKTVARKPAAKPPAKPAAKASDKIRKAGRK